MASKPSFQETGFPAFQTFLVRMVFYVEVYMKPKTLPLPAPWDSDAAVLHLYRCWSNQCRVQLRQITLPNPEMVNALWALWQRNHQRASDVQPSQAREDPGGFLAGIGTWRLLQTSDGSGMIRIEHLGGG